MAIPISKSSSILWGGIRIWERTTGNVFNSPADNPGGYFREVVFSPDGSHIYLGSSGQTPRSGITPSGQRFLWNTSRIQCWEASNWWTVNWSMDGERGSVCAIVPDPNHNRLFVADDGGLWIFDPATGQRRGGIIKTVRE
jgi:DNA-binding beta-propeller fold protein YncE